MKKLFVVILLLALVSACAATLAESPDLAQMDFESLKELKTAVDAEIHARPEAQMFNLYPGNYTVGVDIKAGKYYIMRNYPEKDYSPRIHIYETKEKFDEAPSGNYGEYIYDERLEFGDAPCFITLSDGNYITVENDSVTVKSTEFTEDDYYRYPAPEGTYVSAGVYSVGENGDIPAGSYDIYTASEKEITAGYFFSQEKYQEEEDPVYSRIEAGDKMVMRLEEGYVFAIDGGDAIMKKSAKLKFD